MAAAKPVRLRVGIVGLGRLWEARHKPAFARMSDRLRVAAVYDQVERRAELQAQSLGCVATSGITALIERDDVEAIFLLSPQWFGLQALELAVASGKPIYCALPLAVEPDVMERLDPILRAGRGLFMPEFARRVYPVTIRLRELIATVLGPPRLVLGQVRLAGFDRYGQPGPSTQIAPAPLLIDPGTYLLDWCRYLFQAEPTTVRGDGAVLRPGGGNPRENDVETFAVGFSEGGLAQLSIARFHREAWGEAARFFPAPGLQVYTERGAAWLEMPDHLIWTDGAATHDERLPLEPSIGELLTAEFHRALSSGEPMAPGWNDAVAVARLVLRLKGAARREDTQLA